MKNKFIQKLKLGIVKCSLEIIMFLDFLEEYPFKTAKSVFVISMISLFFILLSGFLVIESNKHYLYDIISYKFIQSTYAESAPLGNKVPVQIKNLPFPPNSARAYIIADLKSKKILKEYNSKTPLPPASTTKLMTALVARDKYTLDQYLQIPEECIKIDAQRVGFSSDEKVEVKDLIGSLLVNSAGDSACALAYGQGDPIAYIASMNKKALENGLTSTNFANPVGLDDFSENHLTSAYDLYLLTLLVREDPYLREVVKITEYDINTDIASHKVFNTNRLLWELPGTVGIKTGKTHGAGEVLIYEYDKDGINLLIIVMGTLDRFNDTQALLEWALQSYKF